MEDSSGNLDRTKLAVGVGTLTSLVLSYFIYKKVVVEPGELQKRKSRRELKRTLRSARLAKEKNQQRIVGANQALRGQDHFYEGKEDAQTNIGLMSPKKGGGDVSNLHHIPISL